MHQRVLHYGQGTRCLRDVCVCVCVSTCLVARSSSRIRCITDEAHGFHGAQDFWVHRRRSSVGKKKKVKFSKYKVHCYNTVFWLNSRVWLEFERFRFKTSVRTSNKTNLKSDTSCCWQNKNTERKLTLLHFCGNELMNSWTHELVVAEIFLYVQSSETDNIIIKWHHTHTHTQFTHMKCEN